MTISYKGRKKNLFDQLFYVKNDEKTEDNKVSRFGVIELMCRDFAYRLQINA